MRGLAFVQAGKEGITGALPPHTTLATILSDACLKRLKVSFFVCVYVCSMCLYICMYVMFMCMCPGSEVSHLLEVNLCSINCQLLEVASCVAETVALTCFRGFVANAALVGAFRTPKVIWNSLTKMSVTDSNGLAGAGAVGAPQRILTGSLYRCCEYQAAG